MSAEDVNVGDIYRPWIRSPSLPGPLRTGRVHGIPLLTPHEFPASKCQLS